MEAAPLWLRTITMFSVPSEEWLEKCFRKNNDGLLSHACHFSLNKSFILSAFIINLLKTVVGS
jgi:hypothetical protein